MQRFMQTKELGYIDLNRITQVLLADKMKPYETGGPFIVVFDNGTGLYAETVGPYRNRTGGSHNLTDVEDCRRLVEALSLRETVPPPLPLPSEVDYQVTEVPYGSEAEATLQQLGQRGWEAFGVSEAPPSATGEPERPSLWVFLKRIKDRLR
jgi:hypothetical protein